MLNRILTSKEYSAIYFQLQYTVLGRLQGKESSFNIYVYCKI
jgi:hypothetical protein